MQNKNAVLKPFFPKAKHEYKLVIGKCINNYNITIYKYAVSWCSVGFQIFLVDWRQYKINTSILKTMAANLRSELQKAAYDISMFSRI